MVVRELMTRFSGDSSGFKQAADEVKQRLTQLTTEYNTNKRTINELQKEINKEVKELNNLKSAMEQAGGGTMEQKQHYAALEKSINDATVKMSQMQVMQTQLRQCMSEATSELRNQNDSVSDVSKSFNNFCDICRSAFTVLSNVSKALVDTTLQAAYMTDTLNTLSAQTGISTQDLQKYQYSQKLIDVSLTDYTNGVSKATQAMKKYQSGNTEVVSALDDLGVSIYDSTGALKDSNVVFNDIIKALGKVGDNAEQDVYAMTLLGKTSATYATLINGGTEKLENFGTALEEMGLILDENQISSLQTVQDDFDSLKAKAQALTNFVGANAAPAVKEILDIIDEIINNINVAIQDGKLQPYINLVTDMLKAVAKMLKTGINILIDWKEAIVGIGVAFAGWKIATTIESLISAIKKAEIAQESLNNTTKANPYILIGSMIIGVISAIVAKIKSAKDETDSFNQSMEQLNETITKMKSESENKIQTLKDLGNKYEELRQKKDRTTEDETKMLNIVKELQNIAPNYIKNIVDETGAYIDLSDAINQATIAIENQTKVNIARKVKEEYEDLVAELLIDINNLSEKIENENNIFKKEKLKEELQAKVDEHKQAYAELKKVTQEYNNIISEFGETTNNQIENQKENLLSVIKAYSNLEDKLKVVTAAEEEFAEKGHLTSSTLEDIVSKYPDLSNSIKDYINGRKSEFDLLGELSKAYNDDYNNYSSEIKEKVGKSEELYVKLVSTNADIVNTFKEQYKIDLTNYQTYSDAKYAIANKTLAKITSDWAKYYDIETNSYTALYSQLYHNNPELAGQIHSAVMEYKNLLKDLEKELMEAATDEYKSTETESTSANKTLSKFDIANEAYKKLVNDRIAMIEKLRDTQVNAIQDQIDAIDAEIKARERLKEDTSIQDEIDAINAKLKYAQIDDFTKYELEKQLKELYQQQEDIAFERNVEDRKNALNNQIEDIKNAATESVNALNEAMTTASEFFTENKNGYKSASQIVNNNSKSANINIINNALTSDQIATAIVKKLYD